jgi:hypothetical protein
MNLNSIELTESSGRSCRQGLTNWISCPVTPTEIRTWCLQLPCYSRALSLGNFAWSPSFSYRHRRCNHVQTDFLKFEWFRRQRYWMVLAVVGDDNVVKITLSLFRIGLELCSLLHLCRFFAYSYSSILLLVLPSSSSDLVSNHFSRLSVTLYSISVFILDRVSLLL